MYTSHEIGAEEHARWFDRPQHWTIRMDGIPVGAAFMSDIDREHRRAVWEFYLTDERTRGKGVGSAVEFLVLEHAFTELELHKLCCEVLSFDEAVSTATHGRAHQTSRPRRPGAGDAPGAQSRRALRDATGRPRGHGWGNNAV